MKIHLPLSVIALSASLALSACLPYEQQREWVRLHNQIDRANLYRSANLPVRAAPVYSYPQNLPSGRGVVCERLGRFVFCD